MNWSAMPSTSASSSGRGTWVWLSRPTSSGSSETTKPSPATSAPSLLPEMTWYAAVARSASRRNQLSQPAVGLSMQVVCPVRDQSAYALGLDQVDEMATGQAAQPGAGNAARQLAPGRRRHDGIPGARQHERWTGQRSEPRARVER